MRPSLPARPDALPIALDAAPVESSPTRAPVAVRASGLGKTVPTPGGGSLEILRDVDLDVAEGDTLAIVGASGSGKSTLLGLLAGLDAPSCGTVHLCGAELTALDEEGRARLRAARVGFVFQSFQLLASLTALTPRLLL